VRVPGARPDLRSRPRATLRATGSKACASFGWPEDSTSASAKRSIAARTSRLMAKPAQQTNNAGPKGATMAEKHILHMITPLKHMSPFDVNMALDAGFDATVAYTGVTVEEVSGLVQDAMFSRPPKAGAKTGIFFGGKNAVLSLDMMDAARKAMFPPFRISLF